MTMLTSAGPTASATIATAGRVLPPIIQGGMGVAVSGWRLARAVGRRGMMGVVSGTGIDQVIARRLQTAPMEPELLDAIAAFPCRETAARALERYHIPGGKPADAPYRTPPMFRLDASREHQAFAVLAAFAEVLLAKRGHRGPIGINLLEKIAMPNPCMIYGAMLAGADAVLMGAGIPIQFPGIIDRLARAEAVSLKIALEDDPSGEGAEMRFDPEAVFGTRMVPPQRPAFLAIVSSPVIAQTMVKRATGSIEGFVVEGHIAGGHNAPPRGPMKLNDRGEPVYGERDAIDLAKFRALGVPFWIAGGMGAPGALDRARAEGAAGIQVGTLFAFCEESGLEPELRRRTLEKAAAGDLCIFTDPMASPTGFPFKVVELEGTLSDPALYGDRERVCDAGYLRRLYRKPDGAVGYRCPGEPEEDYARKGGDAAEACGRKCLCNALLANVGLPQVRHGVREGTLLTAGDDLAHLAEVLGVKAHGYTASDAVDLLLAPSPEGVPT